METLRVRDVKIMAFKVSPFPPSPCEIPLRQCLISPNAAVSGGRSPSAEARSYVLTPVGPNVTAYEFEEFAWPQDLDTTFGPYLIGSFKKPFVRRYEVRSILLRLEDVARIVLDILRLAVAGQDSVNPPEATPFVRCQRHLGGVDQLRRLPLNPARRVGMVDLFLVRVGKADPEAFRLVEPK